MPRNKALDNFLNRSKELNRASIENPEDVEAARVAAGDGPESPTPDPTDGEEPPSQEEVQAEATETSEEEREAQETAEAAATQEAAGGESEPTAEDERDRALKASRAANERLKREREELQRQLALARQQPPMMPAATAAPTPVPTPATTSEKFERQPFTDAEPDKVNFPVDHDQWLTNKRIHEAQQDAAEARFEARQAREAAERFTASQQATAMEQQFMSMMDIERQTYAAEHPGFDQQREYLRGQLREEMKINGVPSHEIEGRVNREEMAFLARQAAVATQAGEAYPGQYALERLAQMARARGYREEATETASPASKTTKAAPAPAAKIADASKRANAARTASTMSSSPATTYDSDKAMTAERFMAMSWAQREAYKRDHPGVLDRLFGGDEETTVNPLLVGKVRALQ